MLHFLHRRIHLWSMFLRYYFGILQLVPDQIRLSMKTVNKLPPHLQAIKRKLGLTLIKFEDAAVDLQPYVRKHIFETAQFLFNSIVKHFKDVSNTTIRFTISIYPIFAKFFRN